MKFTFLFIILLSSCASTQTQTSLNEDTEAVVATGMAIRNAFAKSDVAGIVAHHHPEVIKALNFHTYLNGREVVKADLTRTLEMFNLEFVENKVESLLVQNGTAVEMAVFTIRGTPKGDGEGFIFKGRAQVVYVKYKESPTGWASIRELIQAAE